MWLTTLRADGSAHTTPVWFVLLEETFWIASAASNRKVANLRKDPRVSLAVDGSGNAPQVAEGRAEIHEEIVSHPDVVAAIAAKYDGWDATDSEPHGPQVLLRIPVDRWLLS